jgi:hypothetical protein
MNDQERFPNSMIDRIGSYLPSEQRTSFYRYIAHLRTFNPKDELLILAEGMALFTCIARQVPDALAEESKTLLTELARIGAKHETATTNATADVRNLFAAHQKLLEQNISTWQNREQIAVQKIDSAAKRFEDSTALCFARLHGAFVELQAATKEHHAAATKAQNLVGRISFETRAWPYVACAACGALLALAAANFLRS